MTLESLYERYVTTYSKYSRYENGHAVLSEQDLLDNLAAELEGIVNDYGNLRDYADLDEPNTILEIYSIEESQFLLDQLTKKLQ